MSADGPRFDKVRDNFAQGTKAAAAMYEALASFQTCCVTGQWARVEFFREQAIGALDQYLDNLAAAHREAESIRDA